MTHPDNEIAPDSAVEPLSLERIGDIFKAQNLDFRFEEQPVGEGETVRICLLYTSPSPRDGLLSRMPSSA